MVEKENRTQTIVRDRGKATESITVRVVRKGETKIKDSVAATLSVGEALKKTPLFQAGFLFTFLILELV